MAKLIGVLATEHLAAGCVEDNHLTGSVVRYPGYDTENGIGAMPAEDLVQLIAEQAQAAAQGSPVTVVGVGFPGIIREGVIEESPNLPQVKGFDFGTALERALEPAHGPVRVRLFNDADAMAAGVAATVGHLDRLIRVWTLGNGIGYGRYPSIEGVWEGGHCVVTLDPRENYCGCGGVGHLEGIMGNRSMRKRFLDLEPEEVFEGAQEGDPRCKEFLRMWHRALAAATATSVHMDGSGKFYLTGPNARYIDVGLLNQDLLAMVKMSSLAGTSFEVISTSDEIGIIGAAVNAERGR